MSIECDVLQQADFFVVEKDTVQYFNAKRTNV